MANAATAIATSAIPWYRRRCVSPIGARPEQPSAPQACNEADDGRHREDVDERRDGGDLALPSGGDVGDRDEDGHEREDEPVVEPTLDIERVPDDRRDPRIRDHRLAERRVRRCEDHADQAGLPWLDARQDQERDQCAGEHGERQADPQEPAGQRGLPRPAVDVEGRGVGKQDHDESRLEKQDQALVPGVDVEEPHHRPGDETDRHEEDRHRDDRAHEPPGEQREHENGRGEQRQRRHQQQASSGIGPRGPAWTIKPRRSIIPIRGGARRVGLPAVALSPQDEDADPSHPDRWSHELPGRSRTSRHGLAPGPGVRLSFGSYRCRGPGARLNGRSGAQASDVTTTPRHRQLRDEIGCRG